MISKGSAQVFLLAENRLLREALVRLLTKKGDIRVVGASSYSPAVVDEIVAKIPGILVLDSSGLAFSNATLISSIRASLPDVNIVMVDMESDESTFLKAVREGVIGYVLKDASAMEVAATIRAVAAGEAVCPRCLLTTLFHVVSQPVSAPLPCGSDLGLSRREQQLVELLRERLTNKEIASQLNLSEQTVKNHVHNILRKVGATDRVDAVKLWQDERIRNSTGNRA